VLFFVFKDKILDRRIAKGKKLSYHSHCFRKHCKAHSTKTLQNLNSEEKRDICLMQGNRKLKSHFFLLYKNKTAVINIISDVMYYLNSSTHDQQ